MAASEKMAVKLQKQNLVHESVILNMRFIKLLESMVNCIYCMLFFHQNESAFTDKGLTHLMLKEPWKFNQ
jgi:hypothetical protein